MSRCLVFVKEWKPIGYARFMDYIKFMFRQFDIPYYEFETVNDVAVFVEQYRIELALIVHSFDMIAAKGFPSIPNTKYIGVFMEPIGNIEYYLGIWNHQLSNVYACIVPFLNHHEYFRLKLPNRPIFKLHQGYVPYEDIGEVPEDRPVDVLAAGFDREGIPDRLRVVQALRERGLVVRDGRYMGKDLDDISRKSKVSIYYPLFDSTTTFHGQRTLWAVNKQLCTIGVKSADTENEAFYENVYLALAANMTTFCDKVAEIVKSGDWKLMGQNQFQLYKTKFRGEDLFDKPLLKFLRDVTCSYIPQIDPMNGRYYWPWKPTLQLVQFAPPNMQDLPKSHFQSPWVSVFSTIEQCIPKDAIVSTTQRENGSFNMSLLELRYQTKFIVFEHHYNIHSNLDSLNQVVEVFSNPYCVRKSKNVCIYKVGSDVVVVWPTDNMKGEWKPVSYPVLGSTQYSQLWQALDHILQTFTTSTRSPPFQLCRKPEVYTSEFPIIVARNLQAFIDHLKAYHIEYKPVQDMGVLIPCHSHMDYLLNVLEEYLYICA